MNTAEHISQQILNSMFKSKRSVSRPSDKPIKDISKYHLTYHQAVNPDTLITYFNNTIYLYNYHSNILQLLDNTHTLIKTINLSASRRLASVPISMYVNSTSIFVIHRNNIEIISYIDEVYAVIPYIHDTELKHNIYTIIATGHTLTISTDKPIYKYTSVTSSDIHLYCKKVQVINDNVYYLNDNYEFVVYSLKTHELMYKLPIVYDYCIVGSNIYIITNYTMQLLEPL
jgi:hypothetical protein